MFALYLTQCPMGHIPPGLSLSPSFSPHGSIQPPWLPPASLPQRLSPNPWKFGTNELTAEPLPRSLVPNYTVLHTRFPLQMAWCCTRHCGEHSSRTSTCPKCTQSREDMQNTAIQTPAPTVIHSYRLMDRRVVLRLLALSILGPIMTHC